MDTDTLTWLQKWYASQCDEDWEHTYEVRVGNIDNPGWRVSIDLAETDLEERPFDPVRVERSEHDWILCRVEALKFEGRGGPHNLKEILETFRCWAAPDSRTEAE